MSNVFTVLISGKQGSGKTTVCRELERFYFKVPGTRAINLNFADSIYKIHDFARGYMKAAGCHPPPNVAVKDGPLLQHLGTEWGRKTYGEDVWVNVLKDKQARIIEQLGTSFANLVFIIGDCRFRNEFNAFPNAMRVRLECDREVRKKRVSMWRDHDTHLSETDLDDFSEKGLFNRTYDTEVLTAEAIALDINYNL